MESDELISKMEIAGKYQKNCTRTYSWVSHEDADAIATRAEAEIRANRHGENKLATFKFKSKKTKAKRRLAVGHSLMTRGDFNM